MAKKKTIACDRCGGSNGTDSHIQGQSKKQPLVRPVFVIRVVALVLIFMLCYAIIIQLLISPDRGPEAHAIGMLSNTRSAQRMYQSKYKTYGTFGDLYNAKFLQEETFNVGNGSAYKHWYTFTITVISSSQWEMVGVPDDSNAKWVMIDETGAIYWSEDKGKTWTPLGGP